MIGSKPGRRPPATTPKWVSAGGVHVVWCVFCVVRYDIKGCEVSRWTEPAPEGSQIIVVLKDLNFEGQYITLGKEAEQ